MGYLGKGKDSKTKNMFSVTKNMFSVTISLFTYVQSETRVTFPKGTKTAHSPMLNTKNRK